MYFKSKVWGPFGWYFLHSISYYTYFNKLSNKENEGIKLIIQSLTNLIPCPECRKHFTQKYKKINMDILLQDPNQFVNWIIHIHNEVNKSNKKNQYTRSQVDKLYTNLNKQIINQQQILKFLDILVKSGKYLSMKQREEGFKQLFLGLSNFYPEGELSDKINNYFEKNTVDFKKIQNIERNWDFINQQLFNKLKLRDSNVCFEVVLKHIKTNLTDTVYFKPNICGIKILENWIQNEKNVLLDCKNFDNTNNKISFDVNSDFKILSIKSIDYLNLTIDIRLGKKKNNVVHF